jgi:ubiquinone/menaquinone biosynthesis C-methylase UbiE
MTGRLDPHRRSLAIGDVMARAAATYGRVGPDFFSTAAEGLINEMCLANPGLILDVGCGPGTALGILRERFQQRLRLVGVDLVLNMTVQAHGRLGDDVRLAVMDAQALGFVDGAFDAVLCVSAIYQVPNASLAMAEMLRVLKPGGAIGVSALEGSDPAWAGIGRLYERYARPFSVEGRSFDHESLPDLLLSAGATDIRLATRRLDVAYHDAAEWLDSAWSHGERRALEGMDGTSYQGFVVELPTSLEAAREGDGLLHWHPTAVYAFGRRAG